MTDYNKFRLWNKNSGVFTYQRSAPNRQ